MQAWKDTSKSFENRAHDLVDRMNNEEKASQLVYYSSALPRFGISEYNWWNECLHGVARAGVATVFPQAIGLAASFNLELTKDVAMAISDEARAKHHQAKKMGDFGMYKGLTYWSPNVNIFRDPRWGRGQETYGEDPYLTSHLGVVFCKGLQGDDDKYLKLIATPKHFAVHSGPENIRHEFDARVSKQDMYETYLPAFEACVKEAKAYSVMGAYNRVDGQPCCGSKKLLQDILYTDWGFEGYVVSDCGAIEDFHMRHKVTNTPAESAALALNNGCQLNCGKVFEHLVEAIDQGLVSQKTLDESAYKLILARMKLGMFDPDEIVPYAQIPYEKNDCQEHHELSKKAAAESFVLLKNKDLLPVSKKKIKTIAVIGPNADNVDALIGNYSGTPSIHSTVLEGFRIVHPQAEVLYSQGCSLDGSAPEAYWGQKDTMQYWEAIAAAQKADLVVLVLGLTAQMEGEEAEIGTKSTGGDKDDISLPKAQEKLLEVICAVGKPTVLLNFTGSCVDLRKADKMCDAIIQCWYPGQFGGEVAVGMIFGDYSPSGKLPVTFYNDVSEIPAFSDYSMEGRTYKFFKGTPLYPFGYGLTYSDIEYYRIYLSDPKINVGDDITVTVSLRNKGKYTASDVVQVYLVDEEASTRVPIRKLVAFKKVILPKDKEVKVSLKILGKDMALVTQEGKSVIEPGRFSLYVGGGQPDRRTAELYSRDCLHIGFLVE